MKEGHEKNLPSLLSRFSDDLQLSGLIYRLECTMQPVFGQLLVMGITRVHALSYSS